jgi:hypothetical protein
MKKSLVVLLALSLLVGCSGIPLASLPNLFRFQNSLLDLDPAEFMLAVQVDSKMVPPPDAVPMFQLSIQPAEAGGFEPVHKELPMRITVAASDTLGLPAPSPDRRWLIYSLAPESQIELSEIQNDFKRMQNRKSGGSLSMGIKQEGIATEDPALADSRWESWLQISAEEGFFELWSGTLGDLLQLGENR